MICLALGLGLLGFMAMRHARRGFVSVESDHRVRRHERKVRPYSERRNDADALHERVAPAGRRVRRVFTWPGRRLV